MLQQPADTGGSEMPGIREAGAGNFAAGWMEGTEEAGMDSEDALARWEAQEDRYGADDLDDWGEEPDVFVPADWRSEYGFI